LRVPIYMKRPSHLSSLDASARLPEPAIASRDSDQVFLRRAVQGTQMEFRVIWEIDVDADSPKQAVQQARAMQLSPDMPATVFDVWDYGKLRMHRVDSASVSGRLDRAELTSVRAALRSLQCAPDLPICMQDVVSIMLIFLDEDEGFFRRSQSG
jgi:hypothetical protein